MENNIEEIIEIINNLPEPDFYDQEKYNKIRELINKYSSIEILMNDFDDAAQNATNTNIDRFRFIFFEQFLNLNKKIENKLEIENGILYYRNKNKKLIQICQIIEINYINIMSLDMQMDKKIVIYWMINKSHENINNLIDNITPYLDYYDFIELLSSNLKIKIMDNVAKSNLSFLNKILIFFQYGEFSRIISLFMPSENYQINKNGTPEFYKEFSTDKFEQIPTPENRDNPQNAFKLTPDSNSSDS